MTEVRGGGNRGILQIEHVEWMRQTPAKKDWITEPWAPGPGHKARAHRGQDKGLGVTGARTKSPGFRGQDYAEVWPKNEQ